MDFQMANLDNWKQLQFTHLLNWITKKLNQKVHIHYIHGGWLDIDNFKDLSDAYKQ